MLKCEWIENEMKWLGRECAEDGAKVRVVGKMVSLVISQMDGSLEVTS